MPKKYDVTAQYAAAEAQAAAAKRADMAAKHEASKTTLNRLLKRPQAERFEAIADTELELTTADRRKLVRSLENAAPEKRAIIATTASRVEVWRSRLPYRVIPLAMSGIMIVAVFAFAVTAYRRTPMERVAVTGSEPVQVDWTGIEGSLSSSMASPDSQFVLVRTEGDVAVLRYWVAGVGYAEGRVPTRALRTIK